jgi:hypothetical protein
MNMLYRFANVHPVVALIALAISLFVGVVAAGAIYRAAVTLALVAADALREGAVEAVETISDGIVAVVTGCAKAAARGLGLVGWFAGRPLVRGWDFVRDFAIVLSEGVMDYVARERQLRELFRASPFRTWREFRANFDGGGDAGPAEADKSSNGFEDACSLFGLPLTGLFTQTALNAAFRKLMQKAHPDRAGNPRIAARLNAARDFIRKHKGWN